MTGFSTDASRATGLNPIPIESHAPKEMELTKLGRYRLCFELASGGMATVYLARMEGVHGFEKVVALKRIHPHLVSERAYVEMFLDEARIASGITHPNVCSVFDFGECEGEYYLAMEYLVGEPLSRLARRAAASAEHSESPLLPLRMAKIIAEACEGLHAAHESTDANGQPLNVVHRDVSPKNLFMTYSGVAQVVDFGIASASQRLHRTSTGQLKGTMPYIAPEQITGGPVDRRIDIWSLGVVLWESLTLERLFRRETEAETMYAVLVDDVPWPSERRPAIAPELEAIVMKALERDPEKRWQTSREMGQALHAFLAEQSAVVEAADLSQWMHELFPRGEARKREIMELALTQATRTVPDSLDAELNFADTMVDSAPPTKTIVRPKTKRPVAAVIAVLSALVVAGVWGAMQLGREEVPPARRPEAATAELERTEPAALQQLPAQAPPAKRLAVEPTVAEPVALEPEASEPEPQEAEPRMAAPPEPKARKTAARRSRPRTKPRSTPKPQAPASGPPGKVRIVTQGASVKIYEGGKYLGRAPALLTLAAGRHKLRLESTDTGQSLMLPVNVVSNATKTISLDVD